MRAVFALVSILLFSSCAFAQTLEDRLQTLEKSLKKQEQTIQELKALQKTVKKQEQTIDEQKKLIEKLTAKVQKPQPATDPMAAESQTVAAPEQVQQQVQELKEKVDAVVEAQKKGSPERVQSLPSGLWARRFFLIAPGIECNGQRPARRVRREPALGGTEHCRVGRSVCKGLCSAQCLCRPDDRGSGCGVEEAAIQTTSLPWNLELKAGRFFGEFGRLAYIHDHELPFVNRPSGARPVHRRRIEDRRGTDELPAADPTLREPDRGRGGRIRRRANRCRRYNNGIFRHFGGLSFLGPRVHVF